MGFRAQRTTTHKMKILKVLLLSAGFASADDFQIRTKIEVGYKSSLRLQNKVKDGIRDDLKYLFCTEMEFDGTKNDGCEIKILDDFDNVEEDGDEITGEVQFAVSLEMEEGKSISKSDVKKHFENATEAITTTETPPTVPTDPTETTVKPTTSPEGSGGSGEGSDASYDAQEVMEFEFPELVFADREYFIQSIQSLLQRIVYEFFY